MAIGTAQTGGEPGAGRRNVIARAYRYVLRLSDAFGAHQCSLMACACAFCALLSLVPLLAVGVAAFGRYLGGSEAAVEEVVKVVRAYVPIRPDFVRDVLRPVAQDSGLIGVVGSLGLLFAAHQTFLAMQPALNMVWNVAETRHWFRLRLIAVGATFYTLALLAADLYATAFFAYLENVHTPFLSNRAEAFLLRVGVGSIPVLLTTLMFALMYRFLPCRVVPWRAAFLGAGVAALLWQGMKAGFSLFLVYVHSYDRLYGSLSGLVILVVWTYYSMGAMLLGAEVAADFEFMRLSPRAAEDRAHSGADLGAATGHDEAHVSHS